MKKKKKLLIFGIPIVAVLVIILLVIGKSPSPSDLSSDFEEKVRSGDAEGLMDLVTVNEGVQWDDNSAKSIINYFKEEESDFKDQIMLLDAQASYYETDGTSNNKISQLYPGDSISSIGPFYITKDDSLFGDKYVLKARGYKLKVTGEKGAKVTFNSKNIDMDKESISLGTFGPGVYAIKGKKNFDYITVKDQTKVTLFDIDDEDFEETASLNFTGETVPVSVDIPITLSVNGKETQEIKDDVEFGPVKDGITLQGVTEFPWGKGKSEPQKVEINSEKQYNLAPNPIVDETIKKQITTVINNFYKNSIAAKVKKDPNLLTNVSDHLKSEYTKIIERYDGDIRYFKGEALGTRIDFSQVICRIDEGSYLLEIPVEYHEKSNESVLSLYTEKHSKKLITLKYDEKQKSWLIENETDQLILGDDYMTSEEVVKTTF
ncbi:hypothetical protein ABGT22_19830 [Peribacillus frigoritolerans]|uniref:TcaA 3rd/4th domain-containing protein n=1 Tax=Peribacillus frigoritolerans TaxID=450367 RepID=UPI00345D9EB9